MAGSVKADHRHDGLLRVRRERPGTQAADERDELATFHASGTPVLQTERIAHLSHGRRLLKLRPPVDRPYVGLRWLRT